MITKNIIIYSTILHKKNTENVIVEGIITVRKSTPLSLNLLLLSSNTRFITEATLSEDTDEAVVIKYFKLKSKRIGVRFLQST